MQDPTTTITLNPSTPTANGWYTGPVGVSVSAIDGAGGSGVAQTRCVLDPASVPPSFSSLPSTPCPYLAAGATVSGAGTHTVYAASQDNAGYVETVKSVSFKIDQISGVNGVGPGNSLSAKVAQIQGYIAANDTKDACGGLNAFINEVNAQTDKKISKTQAASFITQARDIESTLGC